MISWGTAIEVGLRAIDAVNSYTAPLNSAGYLNRYVASINNALDLMLSLNTLNEDQLRLGTIGLLQSASHVVQAYHDNEKVRIISNVMVPRLATDALVSGSKFCNPDRRADSFDGFLQLTMWSDEADLRLPSDVILPIEPHHKMGDCLCGAPLAYVSNDVQIVNDTMDWNAWNGDDLVRNRQKEYFQRHRGVLGSFVSFPVRLPDVTMAAPLQARAVVNVQSNRTYAFGRVPANRRKLILLMAPFMQVLGLCLARQLSAEAARLPEPVDVVPRPIE